MKWIRSWENLMDEDDVIEDDTFTKQRRNLLIASISVIAISNGIITLKGDIELFNSSFTVHEAALKFWLPIFFLYCWWRFWCGKGFRAALKHVYHECYKAYVNAPVKNYMHRLFVQPNGQPWRADASLGEGTKYYYTRIPKADWEKTEKETKVKLKSLGEDGPFVKLQITTPKLISLLYWSNGYIRSVIVKDDFSELVLPHIFALYALWCILKPLIIEYAKFILLLP